jgi:hypothetical protein
VGSFNEGDYRDGTWKNDFVLEGYDPNLHIKTAVVVSSRSARRSRRLPQRRPRLERATCFAA